MKKKDDILGFVQIDNKDIYKGFSANENYIFISHYLDTLPEKIITDVNLIKYFNATHRKETVKKLLNNF